MNFRPELAAAVMSGRKWVTRRLVSGNPRSPYHPDRVRRRKDVAVCPGRGKPALGRVRVHSVKRERRFNPRRIRPIQAIAEGFGSPEEFQAAWKAIHGDLAPVDVWRIQLRDPVPSGASEQATGG